MPPFRFLFDTIDVDSRVSADARSTWTQVSAEDSGSGRPVFLLPTYRASALVDYLLSLDQNYDLPADLDLAKYRAVTIWCQRFGVNFGTAPLAAK